MRFDLIHINTSPASLQYNRTSLKSQSTVTPSEIEISQGSGEFDCKSAGIGELIIDNHPSRRSLGLGNLTYDEFFKEMKNRHMQKQNEWVNEQNAQTRAMSSFQKIPDFIRSRTVQKAARAADCKTVFLPSEKPDISYRKKEFDLDFNPRPTRISWHGTDVNPIKYTPGTVSFSFKPGSINLEYMGEPIYVPYRPNQP